MSEEQDQSNLNTKKEDQKQEESQARTYITWQKVVDILTFIFFLGGVTLTALIATGVLFWGPIGLGICAMLGFVGASRLIGTWSGMEYYYIQNGGKYWFDKENEENEENEEDEEDEEDEVENKKGRRRRGAFIILILKSFILPAVFLFGGIALIVLGSLGIMGLGLGLGLGILSIVAASSCFINLHNNDIFKRNVWLSYIAVVGMLAVATFLILGFAGILAWPSALAFGIPAAVVAIVIPSIKISFGRTNWLDFRTKTEELLEPVLFFGGITLTVLILLGILPFGVVGIAICSMLTFIGASRFLSTNSWSYEHNVRYDRTMHSLIHGSDYNNVMLIKLIFSIVGVVTGIVLPVLGVAGVFGLGLGLAIGIPILSASVIGLVTIGVQYFSHGEINSKENFVSAGDNLWSVGTAISGVVAAGVFLGLGFGGVLALPVAVAIAIPAITFSAIIGLIHLALFCLSKTNPEKFKGLKNIFYNDRNCLGLALRKDEVRKLEFLGMGYYFKEEKNNKEKKNNLEIEDDNSHGSDSVIDE